MPKLIQNQLTVRRIATLNTPGHYADGRSLYLYVTPDGRKSWVLRYTLNGRRRDMGLGPLHRVSLAEARDEADAAYKLIRKMIDPIDARNAKRAELTHAVQVRRVKFEEALDQYLATKTSRVSTRPTWRTRFIPTSSRCWASCRSRTSLHDW
jgi:hypothetical protein